MPSNASPLQPGLGMPGLGAGSGPLDRLSLHGLGSVPLGQHGSALPSAGMSVLAGAQGGLGLGEGAEGSDDAPPMKRAKQSFGGALFPLRFFIELPSDRGASCIGRGGKGEGGQDQGRACQVG
jgi:hypothetical protein